MSTVPTSGPMVRIDPDAPGRVAQPKPRITAANTTGTRHSAPEREETAFYDLSRWSKYNDLLLVVGFLILVTSVALTWLPYSLPAAGALLGVGIMKLAWMMGQGK